MRTHAPEISSSLTDARIDKLASSPLGLGLNIGNVLKVPDTLRRVGAFIGIAAATSALFTGSALASGKKYAESTSTKGAKISKVDSTPQGVNTSREFDPADPSQARVEFVYAIPSDKGNAVCAAGQAEVQGRAAAMQEYLSQMEPGYQLRTAKDAKGQTLVDCLNLSQSSADLSTGKGSDIYNSIENQVHQLPGYNPLKLYAVIIDGQCQIADGWYRGMEVGHDVTAICENYDTGTINGVSALEAITLRSIFVDTENPSPNFVTGYTPSGVAVPGLIPNNPNDLLSISYLNQKQYSDWPYGNLSIGSYFKSTPGHDSFDRSPLAEWEVPMKKTGKGTISYRQVESDGTTKPIAPEDGDYFQAGTHLEAVATPAKGYKTAGFSGEVKSNTSTVDLGVVDHLINNETAVFTPLNGPAPNKSETVKVTVQGAKKGDVAGTVDIEQKPPAREGLAAAAGDLACTKTCTVKMSDGSSAVFVEKPGKGYKFTGWLENGKLVTGKNKKPLLGNLTVKNITSPEAVVAKFTPVPKKNK